MLRIDLSKRVSDKYPNLHLVDQQLTHSKLEQRPKDKVVIATAVQILASMRPHNTYQSYFYSGIQECRARIKSLNKQITKGGNRDTITSQQLKEQKENERQRSLDFGDVVIQCFGQKDASTEALNCFVTDLWKAFRPGKYRPTHTNVPPLAKWGRGSASQGPYTRPFDGDMAAKGSDFIQIVSLPGRYSVGGVMGWTTLAHEV